ncbi:MAG: signal peptidase I [Acholeplasmataceae bacterium]
MKKIVIYAVTALTVIIFALSFYIMVFGAIAISNNRLLNLFGYSYSVVPTGSMEGDLEDSLHSGDIIIIKMMDIEALEVGDVIVFYSIENEIHIAHRIIDQTEEGLLITKGDANQSIDQELVTGDMVVGLVVTSFNFLNIGLLSVYYRNVIFLVIIGIILFVLIKEVVKIFKTLKENQQIEHEKAIKDAKQALMDAEKQKMREEILKENEKTSSKD